MGRPKKEANYAIHRANGETWIRLERQDGSTHSWTVIDTADWELVSTHRWRARNAPSPFYAYTDIARRKVYLHAFLHRVPTGLCVDHIDGNGLNNTRRNLRTATNQQNQRNRGKQSNNTSDFKGVHWARDKHKWRAGTNVRGKKLHLGYFGTKEEAARAYDKAAKELHGEFARLNFCRDIEPGGPDAP